MNVKFSNSPSAYINSKYSFLQGQIQDVRKGGWSVVFRKTWMGLLIAPALLAVILVRVLRPLVVIRFASLSGNRIGHYASNTEMYVCERDAGLIPERTIDIFYHASPASNQQLKKMWKRVLHVSEFARYVDWVNHRIPAGKMHSFELPPARDTKGLLKQTQVHLSFTEEEEAFGREGLLEMGVPDGAPFVCFIARDSAYMDATLGHMQWYYHEYRDSNIQGFLESVSELTNRGYYGIRMGAIVKYPLDNRNPRIIDYASDRRTPFLDIYLSAKCKMFLSSGLGLDSVARIFRRPVAYVNFIPLEFVPTWGFEDLFIPKRLWIKRDSRYMTFRETFDSGVGRFLHTEQYDQLGIEPVENTPQEITDLALEMDDRLNGDWESTEEEEELQRQFWSLFKPNEVNGVFFSRIGAKFLRENRELLG